MFEEHLTREDRIVVKKAFKWAVIAVLCIIALEVVPPIIAKLIGGILTALIGVAGLTVLFFGFCSSKKKTDPRF